MPKDLSITVNNKGITPAWGAVATYVTFSVDTMHPDHVSDMVQRAFVEIFDIEKCETNIVFQGDRTEVPILALPARQRVMGKGSSWAIMVVCLYKWDDTIKYTWRMKDTHPPPENVLQSQEG